MNEVHPNYILTLYTYDVRSKCKGTSFFVFLISFIVVFNSKNYSCYFILESSKL